MTGKTTILLVDDNAELRKVLHVLIELVEYFSVTGEAADGREAIDQVRQLQPDIVVMDINMPNLDGIEASKRILAESPQTRILALSIHSGNHYVEKMLEAGVAGYLLKESIPEELITALTAINEGKCYLSTEITEIVLSRFRRAAPTFAGQPAVQNDLSKWKKPELPEALVHRPELLELLDRGLKMPATLVVAPTGYGKSTLVSDWLAQNDQLHIWWSLDPSDNDIRQFLESWITATEELFAGLTRYVPNLIKTANLPPVSILAGALVSELEELPQGLIIVLQNMHLIDEKSILILLSQTLMNPIENKHMVLIYRRDPLLPLPTLRLRRVINEIRTKDLKFTTQFVKAFLEKALARDIDLETAENWKERTEGWVTGLQLAINNLADRSDHQANSPNLDATVNWRDVLTNREYEVLQLLDQRLTTKEIADRLNVSTETIKTHLQHLYRKLRANGRRDAVVRAEELGILR
jgi:ATP/maltotriose-dependent transcriptional regulator MalT/ActR/RegA family two-component response regulator